MLPPDPDSNGAPAGNRDSFPQTRWSLVRKLGTESGKTAHDALGELYNLYWYPLYAYARGRGMSEHDAEDSTQAFFQQLIENDTLATATPTHGRLRSFLLTSYKNFHIDSWRRRTTQKRGGEAAGFNHEYQIDIAAAERRLASVPDTSAPPDLLYDIAWAHTILESVFVRLAAYYKKRGNEKLFTAISGHLSGDSESATYSPIASEFQLSEGAVRQAVFKMRRRFRAYLQQQVAETVGNQTEADEEVAYLTKVLSGSR